MSPVFPRLDRRTAAELPAALATLSACARIHGAEDEARALRDIAAALAPLPPDDRLRRLRNAPGDPAAAASLPPRTAALLRHILQRGCAPVVQDVLAWLPRDLGRLLALPEVPPDVVALLHRELGAVTAGDLAAIARDAEHFSVEGPPLRERLTAWLPRLRSGAPRIPLPRAWAVADGVRRRLRERFGTAVALVPAGSLRRFQSSVGDIQLISVSTSPSETVAAALEAVPDAEVVHRGERLATWRVDDDEVTLRALARGEHACALLHHTGSAAHVEALRMRARDCGLRLTSDTLWDTDGQRIPVATEADVYARLDLPFFPPELREDAADVERARRELPRLVGMSDVRGDLHVHTLWSDGRDSVEAVAWAARSLGYEYVAITDHSPSAAASRVLTLERLERQMEDVAAARARVPGIRILQGIEVDILPDGSLDVPDEVLARLDLVLASLHDSAGQPPTQLLDRYLRAVHHPLVNIITHPMNRVVGRYAGYPIDYDALFAGAAATGTAIEIDGGPAHLDLDGALARRAAAAGATLTIDSDCHKATRLGRQMLFGVGTARRGWVEPRHVLNTRRLDDVLAFFRAKRERTLSAG